MQRRFPFRAAVLAASFLACSTLIPQDAEAQATGRVVRRPPDVRAGGRAAAVGSGAVRVVPQAGRARIVDRSPAELRYGNTALRLPPRSGRAIATTGRGGPIDSPYGRPGLTGVGLHRVYAPPCTPGAPLCPRPRAPGDRPIVIPEPIPVFFGWWWWGWPRSYVVEPIIITDGYRYSDTYVERYGHENFAVYEHDHSHRVRSCAMVQIGRGGQQWLVEASLPQLGATTGEALADVIRGRLSRGEVVRLRHPDQGEFQVKPVDGQRIAVGPCE